MADPAFVERRDAIRARLAAQRNRCASCEKMISMAYETKTKTKSAYMLPGLGSDYSQPLLCVKCWEKSQESERT